MTKAENQKQSEARKPNIQKKSGMRPIFVLKCAWFANHVAAPGDGRAPGMNKSRTMESGNELVALAETPPEDIGIRVNPSESDHTNESNGSKAGGIPMDRRSKCRAQNWWNILELNGLTLALRFFAVFGGMAEALQTTGSPCYPAITRTFSTRKGTAILGFIWEFTKIKMTHTRIAAGQCGYVDFRFRGSICRAYKSTSSIRFVQHASSFSKQNAWIPFLGLRAIHFGSTIPPKTARNLPSPQPSPPKERENMGMF